jgi:hypothetical protein
MAAGYSRRDLLEFLDFLANKGLMKKSTVVSRKAAVNTLLSILEEDEVSDLRKLDVDELLQRFTNLKPHEFKPASLSVYKSRLGSSLADFLQFRRDPTGFKPQITSKERTVRPGNDKQPTEKAEDAPKAGQAERARRQQHLDEVETIVFPIPLRPGVIVKVSGIPSDLTPEEAEKIGNVILALSGSQEG